MSLQAVISSGVLSLFVEKIVKKKSNRFSLYCSFVAITSPPKLR